MLSLLLNKEKLELTEETFCSLLPEYLQKASRLYFTPLKVGYLAAQWLTENGGKTILDIGAGVGKFCVAGAKSTNSFFCGIEYRESVANIANDVISAYLLKNAIVQHGNVVDVDFQNFDGFYIYNPFYENLLFSSRLNDEVELSGSLYGYYLKHTEEKLDQTKAGTRLVTYHGNNFEVPDSFTRAGEAEGGTLKFWIKK